MQRRDFMISSASGAVAAAFAAVPSGAGAGTTPPALGEKAFRGQLGHVFYVYPGLRGVVLQLVALREAKFKSVPGHEQFTLIFQGWRGTPLKSGTYDAENATLGKFQLTLEPLPSTAAALRYRADFSLLG